MSAQRIVTFTTDFGMVEHYVGVMKGVICGINPSVQLVDVTNLVQSFDILDGAIAISQAYSYFPPDTIHVVIVDPGVGSSRRPIVAKAGTHIFVAPDNGVLSLVYEREEAISVRHITAEHYFRQPVSSTFHGRDVFATVAGYLSKGVEPAKFGDEITDYVRFVAPKPKPDGTNSWKGVVLKIDKFGNIITNITPKDIPQLFQASAPKFKISVGKVEITRLSPNYADGGQGETVGLLGSTGFLEISVNRGSAARAAGADKGAEVSVTIA
ncbi:MAG TPA: SAM-dependent chlorinase/fluorinase [Candidatus Angelobacter sp.]|nr:SAM-dependent chlorinase/fluorinase [Candidatus Angelobacter sp.]